MAKKRKIASKSGRKVAKPAKTKTVPPMPGFHAITPFIVARKAGEAIDFYKRAFGAKERFRMATPDGRIGHAELQVGDSIVMLADEFSEKGALAPAAGSKPPVSFYLYVTDCDGLIQSATQAGATLLQPAQDMFWGDRYGTVQDPFGHMWSIATHKRDVSPEEMHAAAVEHMKPQLKPVDAVSH